jgi:hypothetical protein
MIEIKYPKPSIIVPTFGLFFQKKLCKILRYKPFANVNEKLIYNLKKFWSKKFLVVMICLSKNGYLGGPTIEDLGYMCF